MIRKEAVVNFAHEMNSDHTYRDTRAPFDYQQIIDMFPQFLAGFEFGRKLADTGHEVIFTVNVREVGIRKFTLGNFRLLVGLEELHHQQPAPFNIVCDAMPLFDTVDEHFGVNPLEIRLKSGAGLFIDFHLPGQAEGPRRYLQWREARRGSDHDNLSSEDRSMLDTVSLMASTAAIDYISAGFQSWDNDTRKLAPISYMLSAPDRVSAVHRIINTNYAGDNGENILVQNLMTGKTFGSFSNRFGSSQDWINAHATRGEGFRSAPFDYTSEETEALAAYSLVLKEAAEGMSDK